MNYKMMGRFIAQILSLEGIFMIPAICISLYCGDGGAVRGFGLTMLLIAALVFCLDTDWPLKLYSTIGGTKTVLLLVGAFVVFVVLYSLFSFYMFRLKYDRHRGNLRRYGLNLKRLDTIYTEEAQNEQTDKFSK